jgi:hypothetical protein
MHVERGWHRCRSSRQAVPRRRTWCAIGGMSKCRICLIDHDAAIHAASLRVHSWLRARLQLVLRPAPKPEVWKPRAQVRNEIHLPGSSGPT